MLSGLTLSAFSYGSLLASLDALVSLGEGPVAACIPAGQGEKRSEGRSNLSNTVLVVMSLNL
jgi:hypothetical protein